MNTGQTAAPRQRRALVIGLGSSDRGDDAIGPMVASRVRDVLLASGDVGVDVVVHADPTALPDLFSGIDVAVIVDAVQSGDAAGTVTCSEVGRGEPALPARAAAGFAGTHGLGLAGVIELARVLDQLPDRVVVVGVEGAGFEHGDAVSAPALAAVERAVDMVLGLVRPSGP